MEVLNAVLGAIQKLGLTGWPLVALVFFLVFRRPIAEWIPTIRKVGAGGVEAGPPPSQVQTSTARETETEPARAAEELAREFTPPLIVEQEKKILDDLKQRRLPESENMKLLVRYLASFQLGYLIEATYRAIFGSQIALLHYLNTVPSAHISVAQNFYGQAANTYRDFYRSYPFESWLTFLTSWNLVTRTGDQISITPLGKEFLAYLVRVGIPANKPF